MSNEKQEKLCVFSMFVLAASPQQCTSIENAAKDALIPNAANAGWFIRSALLDEDGRPATGESFWDTSRTALRALVVEHKCLQTRKFADQQLELEQWKERALKAEAGRAVTGTGSEVEPRWLERKHEK